jgi:dipeptidase E
MKLFLSSFFSGVSAQFADFTGNTCNGKRVLFIPTASNVEKVTFFVGSDKKALTKLGVEIDELDVSDVSAGETAGRFEQADYVFVEGGNTFYLLQELKKSGADKRIVDFIKQDKIYIGASAGSMVLSRNIEYVRHMDKPTAAPDLNGDFTALSVIDFCVVPHATNAPFKKAAEKIVKEYSDKYDLRLISNNQAITINNDTVEVVTAPSKK